MWLLLKSLLPEVAGKWYFLARDTKHSPAAGGAAGQRSKLGQQRRVGRSPRVQGEGPGSHGSCYLFWGPLGSLPLQLKSTS